MTKQFQITDKVFMQLQDCGLQEMSLSEAGKVIGAHNKAIARAAIRQNLASWLVDLFPTCRIEVEGPGRHSEIRWLRPEHVSAPLPVNMQCLHVRAATMQWRA